MNKFVLFALLLLLSACKTSKSAKPFLPVFPDDWLGGWQGDLDIYNTTGKVMTVPMQCWHQIRPDGSYDWQLVYGSGDKQDVRAYELKKFNTAKGHYQIDEKNGILIDAFVLHDRLVSTFSVMENVIQTHYIIEKDLMTFEVYMHNQKEISLSGDTIINGDTIPAVRSFNNQVYQRAVLKRIRK
ncbi:MAG: hypothetical protein KBF57_06455 [Saprospiraceae bacterium]|jgi:hypothetical protein|nr:hypothetical protein [Saprospiraceae bacterium]MBP9194308.1 hypothetical protein [Saprospiraceae bacterium]